MHLKPQQRIEIGVCLVLIAVSIAAAAPEDGFGDEGGQPKPNGRLSSGLPSDLENKSAPAAAGGRIDGYLAGGRWREGSKLVDVVGQFQVSGDRAAFTPADGKSRFPCLENLNSERVARIVGENPEALDWVIQGTITEFRGENYLLITQAVIRTRTTRGRSADTPGRSNFRRPTPGGGESGD